MLNSKKAVSKLDIILSPNLHKTKWPPNGKN